ncbi:MAG: hypothetical protein D6820_09350 [Lentisphaerae bacterium]|nr:MAG: hypothetical protein D6820_09350 [Lentisphaerota bacterium]
MNSLIENINPANFPIQAGSLVDAEPARRRAKLHDKDTRRELPPSAPVKETESGELVTNQSSKTNSD